MVNGVTLDLVNGSSTSVLGSESISIQEIDGHTIFINNQYFAFSRAAVADAAALETAIETTSLIRSDGALARYDAFIQYKIQAQIIIHTR